MNNNRFMFYWAVSLGLVVWGPALAFLLIVLKWATVFEAGCVFGGFVTMGFVMCLKANQEAKR